MLFIFLVKRQRDWGSLWRGPKQLSFRVDIVGWEKRQKLNNLKLEKLLIKMYSNFNIFLNRLVSDQVQYHLQILLLGNESIQIMCHLLLQFLLGLFRVLFEVAENLRTFFENVGEFFSGPFYAVVDQIRK